MKRLFFVLALLTSLSTGFTVFLYFEVRQLKAHVADLEMETKLRQLENDLKVPSETIYYDGPAMKQIAEIRQDVYESHGVEWFVPYKNVFHGKTMMVTATEDPGGKAALNTSHWTSIVNGSVENFWLNHAIQICFSLAGEFENEVRLGGYLSDHPDVFKQRIRPALVRLLACTHEQLRIGACKVLVVAGDRSDEVMHVLAQFIRQPNRDVRMNVNGKSTVVKRPSTGRQAAIELNKAYNLGLVSSHESGE